MKLFPIDTVVALLEKVAIQRCKGDDWFPLAISKLNASSVSDTPYLLSCYQNDIC